MLAKQYGIREHSFEGQEPRFVPFTAQTRMSGVDVNGARLRKGAGDSVLQWVEAEGGQAPPELAATLDRVGREGGTPLAVARDNQVLGVVYLKDVVKEGMRERFDRLRAMGIRTSWSPATTGSPPRRSPTSRASTTSSPRRRPRPSSS